MIGKKNRGTVLRMYDDRARRTGRDAIITFCTTLKEQLFSRRTRGAQPVNTRRRRRRLRRKAIRLFGEFARRFNSRNDGIFQKISPAV